MKAIVFFEGKEVCQVEYDYVKRQYDGLLEFYLNEKKVADFTIGYSYLIIPEKIPLTESEILEWKAKITHATEGLKIKWWQF
jgi:hypothetical protein